MQAATELLEAQDQDEDNGKRILRKELTDALAHLLHSKDKVCSLGAAASKICRAR